jgi:hypothetical protein
VAGPPLYKGKIWVITRSGCRCATARVGSCAGGGEQVEKHREDGTSLENVQSFHRRSTWRRTMHVGGTWAVVASRRAAPALQVVTL